MSQDGGRALFTYAQMQNDMFDVSVLNLKTKVRTTIEQDIHLPVHFLEADGARWYVVAAKGRSGVDRRRADPLERRAGTGTCSVLEGPTATGADERTGWRGVSWGTGGAPVHRSRALVIETSTGEHAPRVQSRGAAQVPVGSSQMSTSSTCTV